VKAKAPRVAPRVEEADDPGTLVSVRVDQEGQSGHPERHERGDHQQVRPGGEEHHEGGDDDHRARAEVGLAQDQRHDGQGDRQERQHPGAKASDPLAARGHPVGQVDDQGELGELGRMERRERPESQPAR